MTSEDLTDYTKNLYNNADSVWPSDDLWHRETKNYLDSSVKKVLLKYNFKNSKILNAGSGGTHYGDIGLYYDCDIAEETISKCQHPIVSSVEKLPCVDKFFDISICVGSVINYCDATKVISELYRTLKQNGILILEFERSNSAEFLFTNKHSKSSFINIYDYNNQKHKLWMYSENYIRKCLESQGFKIIKKRRYHILSSLVYRFTGNDNKSSKYIKYDSLVQFISYPLAHNIIILCRK